MKHCKYIMLALGLAAALNSCGLQGKFGGKSAARPANTSYTGELPDTAVAAMSWAAAEKLVDLYPPGRTTLYLNYPPKGKDKTKAVFDELFEINLRANGFRITAESSADSPRITWRVDMLPNETGSPSWYLWLHILDRGRNVVFSRVYDEHGKPEASFVNGIIE